MTRKKFIIITIAILLAILLGLLIYNLFFKSTPPSVFDPVSGLSSPEETLGDNPEPIGDIKFAHIIKEPIMSFELVGDSIFFIDRNGSLKELNATGEIKNISDFTLDNILGAEINPEGSGAVLLVSENSEQKERWLLLDKSSTRLRALNLETRQVSFSSQGEMLIIEKKEKNTTSLILKNNNGEEIIFTTNIPDLTGAWLDEETIVLGTKPSGLATSALYLLNTKDRDISPVLEARNGLTGLVSNDKNWALFSQTSSNGKNLSFKVLNINKKEERPLAVSSLPEKCVFGQDKRFAYCATFLNNPNTSIMPDNYYKDVFSPDKNNFVKISLVDGSIETIYLSLNVDAINLELSTNEDYLFFINKKDGNLHRLRLESSI